MQTITKRCVVSCCAIVAMAAAFVNAADYYYDPSRTSGWSWHEVNAWSTTGPSGPFDQTWVDGNTANFNFTTVKIASLDSTTAQVAALVNGTANAAWIASASPVDLTFTGGATISGGSGGFQLRGSVTAVGPCTLSDGLLNMTGTAGLRGTMTIQGGTVYPQPTTLTNSSHFALTGGNLYLDGGDTYPAIGSVALTSGEFRIGRYNGAAVAATIHSLSGSGGTVFPRMVAAASDGVIESLTVDQATNTTFAGTVDGYELFLGYSYLTFTKSGAGALTLAGTVDLRQGTIVNGGRLYLSGASAKSFRNVAGGAGSDAIHVTGGALGGTSTLNVYDGTDVTVDEGGGLVAGLAGMADKSLYAFVGGELDISGATASNAWLHFDLGNDATAGTTYDQIQVTGGTLAIGSGLLSINDFSFNALAGLDVGTYTLFDSAALSGSLGAPLNGRIATGYHGTLRIDGNDIVMDVTPPPGTTISIR